MGKHILAKDHEPSERLHCFHLNKCVLYFSSTLFQLIFLFRTHMTWLQNILKETWNQRLYCIVRRKSGLRWFTYVLIFSFHIGCWHEQKWFMDKRMNVQFVEAHTYCVNLCTVYKYIIPLSCSYFKCKNFIFHIFLMTKKKNKSCG